MMTKNTRGINSNEISIFKYELSKIKNNWSNIFLITIAIQLLSFIFFAIVGKFDGSVDTISSFLGIIALSNTVSMCAISIYGAVLLRKDLVRFYIGDQRNRTFLFPVDRNELLTKKSGAFFTIILTGFGSGLLVSLTVEVIVNFFLKLNSSSVLFDLSIGLVSIAVSCCLIFLILILSEIISIWKQSEIATIIVAVAFMLMFSNFSAMGMINFPIATFVSSVIMAAVVILVFSKFSKNITRMEVY